MAPHSFHGHGYRLRMSARPDVPVTLLLEDVARGRHGASEELMLVVYSELRKLAKSRLDRLQPGNTLQPTALVHEAYIRLLGAEDEWKNRAHFFAAAAQSMRNILVDRARAKAGPKRGGNRKRIDLDACVIGMLDDADQDAADDFIVLNTVLDRLHVTFPKHASVVMLRCFGGLTHDKISHALDVSVPTVERYWRFARAWLQNELRAFR